MSTPKSHQALLEQLQIRLQTDQYSTRVQQSYTAAARRFLGYLEGKALAIEQLQLSHIEDFVQRELRLFRKRHGGQPPRHMREWRWHCTSPIRMLLRCILGRWPTGSAPQSAVEEFHRDVVNSYAQWMQELRGLAEVTRSERCTQALQFLMALGSGADRDGLKALSVRDVDAYLQRRCVGLRRRSIKDYSSNLRIFLRYLHETELTAADLSGTVIVPRIYTHDIPSALRPAEVEQVLEATRHDRSASGMRAYAILTLLAIYGLRAREIVALRLDDIDWRNDVVHVRHSKTGAHSELPLLREAGHAILQYLQRARPKSALREVFLHLRAPYHAFKNVTALYDIVQSRLAAAGVRPAGRRGPHAFRHARAVGLLRASVPLKTIGDILGHRSSLSTGSYLKLATEDLRAVGLNVPYEVLP
jgi:integrase/recombinase XerD